MGYLYLLKGEFDSAESLLKNSIELDPKYERPHYNLGALYISRGETEKGIKEYKTAINIGPDVINEHIKDLDEMRKEHPDWNWTDQAKKLIDKISGKLI